MSNTCGSTTIEVTRRGYRGRLSNLPLDITSITLGDTVTVPKDRVSDWFAIDDGKLVGGYTLRLQRARLPPEQARRVRRNRSSSSSRTDSARGASCTNPARTLRCHARDSRGVSRSMRPSHSALIAVSLGLGMCGLLRLRAPVAARWLPELRHVVGWHGPRERAGDGGRQTVRRILRPVRRAGIHRHGGAVVHAVVASADASLPLGRQVTRIRLVASSPP